MGILEFRLWVLTRALRLRDYCLEERWRPRRRVFFNGESKKNSKAEESPKKSPRKIGRCKTRGLWQSSWTRGSSKAQNRQVIGRRWQGSCIGLDWKAGPNLGGMDLGGGSRDTPSTLHTHTQIGSGRRGEMEEAGEEMRKESVRYLQSICFTESSKNGCL